MRCTSASSVTAKARRCATYSAWRRRNCSASATSSVLLMRAEHAATSALSVSLARLKSTSCWCVHVSSGSRWPGFGSPSRLCWSVISLSPSVGDDVVRSGSLPLAPPRTRPGACRGLALVSPYPAQLCRSPGIDDGSSGWPSRGSGAGRGGPEIVDVACEALDALGQSVDLGEDLASGAGSHLRGCRRTRLQGSRRRGAGVRPYAVGSVHRGGPRRGIRQRLTRPRAMQREPAAKHLACHSISRSASGCGDGEGTSAPSDADRSVAGRAALKS